MERQGRHPKEISSSGSTASRDMFRPADYVPHRNKDVPNNISLLITPLMDKFPKTTA
jgi:hypothetical protein